MGLEGFEDTYRDRKFSIEIKAGKALLDFAKTVGPERFGVAEYLNGCVLVYKAVSEILSSKRVYDFDGLPDESEGLEQMVLDYAVMLGCESELDAEDISISACEIDFPVDGFSSYYEIFEMLYKEFVSICSAYRVRIVGYGMLDEE